MKLVGYEKFSFIYGLYHHRRSDSKCCSINNLSIISERVCFPGWARNLGLRPLGGGERKPPPPPATIDTKYLPRVCFKVQIQSCCAMASSCASVPSMMDYEAVQHAAIRLRRLLEVLIRSFMEI